MTLVPFSSSLSSPSSCDTHWVFFSHLFFSRFDELVVAMCTRLYLLLIAIGLALPRISAHFCKYSPCISVKEHQLDVFCPSVSSPLKFLSLRILDAWLRHLEKERTKEKEKQRTLTKERQRVSVQITLSHNF